MRILMMGTGPFAVPTFEALVKSRHEVVGLITRPPAGSHRRKRKDVNPMREAAEGFALPVHDPASVNDPDFAPILHAFEADLFVVCDYGQILSKDVLSIPRIGGINLHGSLLPRYRGAAPINWSIYNGDSETGDSVILMTPRLDGGPIIGTVVMPVTVDDTAITVEENLSRLGAGIVLDCIEQLESWDGESPIGQPQDPRRVTKAPRLKKTDGQIDWSRTAAEIVNQVRAFQPWPGSYSNLIRKNHSPVRLILTKAAALSDRTVSDASGEATQSSPGTIVHVDNQRMVVQASGSQLEVLMLQPAGKKAMPTGDFLRGNPVVAGDRFEVDPENG